MSQLPRPATAWLRSVRADSQAPGYDVSSNKPTGTQCIIQKGNWARGVSGAGNGNCEHCV